LQQQEHKAGNGTVSNSNNNNTDSGATTSNNNKGNHNDVGTNTGLNNSQAVQNAPSSTSVPRITNTYTPNHIETSIPAHASSVIHILDRRIPMDSLPSDTSLYALVRSWVQDDPCRVIPPPGLLVHDDSRISESTSWSDSHVSLTKSTVGGGTPITNSCSILDTLFANNVPEPQDEKDLNKPTWQSLQQEHVQRAKEIQKKKREKVKMQMRQISKKLKPLFT